MSESQAFLDVILDVCDRLCDKVIEEELANAFLTHNTFIQGNCDSASTEGKEEDFPDADISKAPSQEDDENGKEEESIVSEEENSDSNTAVEVLKAVGPEQDSSDVDISQSQESDQNAKEDGIVLKKETSDSNTATKVVKEPRDPLYDQIDVLFEDMERKKFCFDAMKEIAARGEQILKSSEKTFVVPIELFKTAADRLVMVNSEIDIRVRTYYLQTFRVLFMFVENFNEAMRYVYGLEFKNDFINDHPLPKLQEYIKDYNVKLLEVLKVISSEQFTRSEILHNTRELAFLLMIGPRATLKAITLFHVSKAQGVNISRVVKTLRHIPAFCELRSGTSHCHAKGRLMIISLIFRLFFLYSKSERDMNFANCEHQSRLLAMLSMLACTRYREDGRVWLSPLLDASELIVDLVYAQLSPTATYNSVNINFSLDLLRKLLTPHLHKNIRDECVVRWKSAVETKMDAAVEPGLLLHYLTNVSMMKQTDNDIKKKCLGLMQTIVKVIQVLAGVPELTNDVRANGTANFSSPNSNNQVRPIHQQSNHNSSQQNEQALHHYASCSNEGQQLQKPAQNNSSVNFISRVGNFGAYNKPEVNNSNALRSPVALPNFAVPPPPLNNNVTASARSDGPRSSSLMNGHNEQWNFKNQHVAFNGAQTSSARVFSSSSQAAFAHVSSENFQHPISGQISSQDVRFRQNAQNRPRCDSDFQAAPNGPPHPRLNQRPMQQNRDTYQRQGDNHRNQRGDNVQQSRGQKKRART